MAKRVHPPVRAQRDLSDSLSPSEWRVWRRFASRFRKAWGVTYPYRVRADQLGFDWLMRRCGGDADEILERIEAAFASDTKPTSLLELARMEERREFGRELDEQTAVSA